MKDDRLYRVDILEAVERIDRYTREGRDAFFVSTLVQDGVIRNFEIIREAVKQMPEHLREREIGDTVAKNRWFSRYSHTRV